jgi:hypothetical protein
MGCAPNKSLNKEVSESATFLYKKNINITPPKEDLPVMIILKKKKIC